MRRKRQGQLDLAHTMPRTEIGRELAAMSKVLDEMPKIYEVAYLDLIGLKDAETGRTGMTAEQVVRAAHSQAVSELELRGIGVSSR